MGHSHRSGTLKQKNKPFKSRHSSKGALKDAAKGRTHRPSGTTTTAAQSKHSQLAAKEAKANRKNHLKQVQQRKREHVDDNARIFAQKDPKVDRIVTVVPLTADLDSLSIVSSLADAAGVTLEGDSAVKVARVTKFHGQTLKFLLCPPASEPDSLLDILDATAAADFVIVGLSAEEEVDTRGETLIRTLTAVGTGPNALYGVIPNLPSDSTASSIRMSLHSYLNHFHPIEKLFSLMSPSEASNLVRGLCEKIPRGPHWRESRARVLADKREWRDGTLAIEGIVRGARLSVDRLVHIQGVGDFRIAKMTLPATRAAEEEELLRNEEDADDLVSTNVPSEGDDLLNEQTWPTEEEIASAPAHRMNGDAESMPPPAANGTTPKSVRAPRGVSEYQATWLEGDEVSDYDPAEGNGDKKDDDMIDEDREPSPETEDADFKDDVEAPESSVGVHFDLPDHEEADQLAEYLSERQKLREQNEDFEFPDEIDTPRDVPARERFARYRGLKSMRTSPWDPYENLPDEYSRCFMLDWRSMSRRAEKRARDEGVQPGARVVLYLDGVPESVMKMRHLLVFGLHGHEHKYSVVHFTVQRNTEYEEPVRSKDALILLLGPRRYHINPVFSSHTTSNGGKGSNNVHKFERFLKHGQMSIGTVYMPITLGSNVPAVLLRPPQSASDSAPSSPHFELVSSGLLFSADPTRVIAKRIVLSGLPYKVHKKTATIRYMFFNAPDIMYYKPVQLRTKKGRTGYIRESLGTHGYFKAGFDGPIDQMDTVLMSLYKRQFPKWTTRPVLAPEVAHDGAEGDEDGKDVEMA